MKSALAKLQKRGYCFVCDMSLFNSEDLEIYYILFRRENSDYSLKILSYYINFVTSRSNIRKIVI